VILEKRIAICPILPDNVAYFGVAEQKPGMQSILPEQPEQATHLPSTDGDIPTSKEAGDEAARAVARMRHLAIDNWDQVAHFTQATLAENGLSYREQEMHTGVGASTVYRMALGNAVGVRAVQQFAAFAAYSSRREETKAFWSGTLSRFNPVEEFHDSADASPESIAALYAALAHPDNRRAVAQLLRALQASETAAG
jgi:hypothetical protein